MTILNHDFLALTLANPHSIAPFELDFPSGTGVVEDTGILRLEPHQAKQDISLVLSVGVHGNETGPIELVNELLIQILSGRLTLGIRLLVLIGNPVAANAGKRFCEVNLNRLFHGGWQGYQGFEAKRAERLEQAIDDFYQDLDEKHTKLHYDLHTAIRGSEHEKFVVYPYVKEARYSKQQLSFLAASGIDAVLLSHQATTTFSFHSYETYGAHAFTIELGKVYPFGQNDLSRFTQMESSLCLLLEEGTFAQSEISLLSIFTVLDALIKDDESYQLNIAEDANNFSQFESDFLLSSSKKSEYRVKQSGDAIVFPNTNLPIGQRAGLVVRPISAHDLSYV